MRLPPSPPRRAAVFVHPEMYRAGSPAAEEITQSLLAAGLEKVVSSSAEDQDFRERIRAGEFELVIAVGGDGTMLRAGHLCAPLGIPILGVNLGRFGFLMEVKKDHWPDILPRLLVADYRLEERMMLHVEHWREKDLLGSYEALNEVVVSRGRLVRPIQVAARVDGYRLASFVADGLIVSSPTGSTAYALAVGGPILPPELQNILIIPVAPHLSIDRAIILPADVCVSVTLQTYHEAVISLDGQNPIEVINGDSIRVSRAQYSVTFLRFQDPGYFYRNLAAYMEQNPIVNDGDL